MTTHAAPGLGLHTGVPLGSSGWGNNYNADMLKLSAVVQLRALSMTTPLPADDSNSAGIADGDIYIMPASDSNSIQDSNSSPFHGSVAIFDAGAWVYYTPSTGWIAFVVDQAAHYTYVSGAWTLLNPATVPNATAVPYDAGDNGDSNSAETNVAGALDDLYERVRGVGTPNASVVPYDSGSAGDSNSTETTVAAALDDLYERGRSGFYDLSIFIGGVTDDAELVYRQIIVRAFSFPAALTGSYASALVASTGDVSFTMKRNGTAVGTVRFNISSTGVFDLDGDDSNSTGPVYFLPTDVFTIEAPATADATLSDITLSFKGDR